MEVSKLSNTPEEDANQYAWDMADVANDRSRSKSQSNSIPGTSGKPALEQPQDGHIVWWEGDDDPENPYNWPAWRTRTTAIVLTALAFLIPLASSIIAPGVPQLMREFHRDSDLLSTFVVSVFVLGLVFGPLIFAPLSEIYGRLIIYHISNVSFIAFSIACAVSPTLDALIVFRFLSGFFGSCTLSNGAGSLADMLTPDRRGKYTALYTLGPVLGPTIGPVIAGFLSEAKGWRWLFWLVTILAGFISLILLIFGRETYAPIILQRKVDRLKKETGNLDLRHKLELDSKVSPSDHFRNAIVRPFRILIFSPVSIASALYLAITYGYLYLMFSSVVFVFEEQYHFPNNLVGLVFLGIGIGSIIGMMIAGFSSDRAVKAIMAKGEAPKPEIRMQLTPVGGVFLPAGLFIYGWTAQYQVHWMAPIIGLAVMGVGIMIIFMSILLYLIDTFERYAASALAANSIMRSLGGALLPLAALSMFGNLGIGWGCSLLGFIATAMIPVPIIFLRYGEWLRTRFEVKNL